MPRLEEVLAEGLALSHQDATVARVLPLVFWRHRGRLDEDALVDAATRRNERQALGFFLELTGHLGGDSRWESLAERLRDHRLSRARPFFARAVGRMSLALARRRTPALARRWGFLMNMDLESFASAFTKHGEAEVMVPERHDLVLMKVLRGDEHDLQAIEAIHERSPLDLSILVERFRDEMGSTIIARGRLKGQFLTMIERLSPADLDGIERRLRARER
jgi:hypothetical protein